MSRVIFFLIIRIKFNKKKTYRVSEALIFGAWMLGQALAYAPNVNSAMLSAGRLMKLLDRTPKMHNPSSSYLSTFEVKSLDCNILFIYFLILLFFFIEP